MSYTVYGDYWESGELANTNKYQSFKPNKDAVLRAIRTQIIVNNDPTFTNLTAKLYSDDSGPDVLIANSTTTLTKAQIITENNGLREVYFEFDFIPLEANDMYNIVINGAGYTYSSSSHLAWKKAWPSPIYRTNWTADFEDLAIAPYDMHLIGANF